MDHFLDHRIETLAVVAQTGSLTAAAKVLFISQPAISQQLASLEVDLKLPLLSHQGRRITLTPAAKELVSYANRLERDNQAVLNYLRNGQTPPLKLGVTRSLAAFLLPRLLKKIIASDHQVTVTIGNTAELSAQLLTGQLSVALIEGNFERQEFAAEPIGNAAFAGISGHLISQPSLTTIFDHLLLVRELGSGTREILTSWLAAHNASLSDFKQSLALSSPLAIIESLKQDLGISFMYRALVKVELAEQSLFEIALPGFPLQHPLNLIYLKGSTFASEFHEISQLASQVLQDS